MSLRHRTRLASCISISLTHFSLVCLIDLADHCKMSKLSVGSVDLEQPKVVLAVVLENEVRSRFGPEFGTFGEPEQARHLARLQEVEHVRPRGWGGPVALDALQGRAVGHRHLQLHILTLVLVEVHLTETEGRTSGDRQTDRRVVRVEQ